MTPSVEQAGKRLRRAVQTGSFAQAQDRLREYARVVNAALAAAGPNDPGVAETLSAALNLLHWADKAVRAGRAHAGAGLVRLAAARSYRPTQPAPSTTFQLEV